MLTPSQKFDLFLDLYKTALPGAQARVAYNDDAKRATFVSMEAFRIAEKCFDRLMEIDRQLTTPPAPLDPAAPSPPRPPA
jgi:hypothetical protein